MDQNSKIYIAGHRGLVGSAIVRNLRSKGFTNLIMKTHRELDLTRQSQVEEFFVCDQPEYVFLAAAKVGGIHANKTYPADFIMQNLQIECNIIDSAFKTGVKKLLFLGSSCIYPKLSPQPIKEEYLLTGPLEPTNEAYALAKISGLKMCQYYNSQYGTRYLSVMPTNLYGPYDDFDLQNSHVLPALIRRLYEAKKSNMAFVELWGTGCPRREFLHVDDMAHACIYLMQVYDGSEIINIGTGKDISIMDLAALVASIIGYDGQIIFSDKAELDGTPRKLLDTTRLKNLGWNPSISLSKGIADTCRWYIENVENPFQKDKNMVE